MHARIFCNFLVVALRRLMLLSGIAAIFVVSLFTNAYGQPATGIVPFSTQAGGKL